MRTKTKEYLTTREDRARARRKREKAEGLLAPVNLLAVQYQLRGRPLSRVSRLTEIPRRTLDHLRSGKVRRTRYKVLACLAAYFKVDVGALIGQPDAQPSLTPGAYACEARAKMTLRLLIPGGAPDASLLELLTRAHDLDTLRNLFGADGLAVFERDSDESGWHPNRTELPQRERLRTEYAEAVHALFRVLIEASSKEAGRGIQCERLRSALRLLTAASEDATPAIQLPPSLVEGVRQEMVARNGEVQLRPMA